MPSGRKKSLPDEDPVVVFFLDRGLGRHLLADMLREAGHVVYPMADVYPDGLDQEVGDDEWIERASAEGWIALTKDLAIIRDHQEALTNSTLRVFALNNANISGAEIVNRFSTNLNRILQRSRQRGPYVYVVTTERIELRWPPK